MKRIKKRKWFGGAAAVAFLGLVLALVADQSESDRRLNKRQETAVTTTAIAPGISERKVVTRDENNDNQIVAFVTTYDTVNYSNIGVTAGYKDMNFEKFGTSTVRQIAAIATGQGRNVVSAINAGPFKFSNGEQRGPLVHDGVVYNDYTVVDGDIGSVFFGVTTDSEYVVGSTKAEFLKVKSKLRECVSGMELLIKDGENVASWDQSREPRTAVGFTRDGRLLSAVFDGRNYPVSVGATYQEMAETMLANGAYGCVALDGGGSSTLLNKVEGDSELTLRNTPSDGAERRISSALLFYVDAEYDGNFTHASIYPNNAYYTPGSEVQFTAKGVDGAGGPAAIPSGSYWAIGDSALGSIDSASGLFVSSGVEGEVKIYLRDSRGTNLGSAQLNLRQPDALSFANSAKSVGFDTDVDLGLHGYYQGIELELKSADIDFELSDPGLGAMNGMIFHSNPDRTISGNISAYSSADRRINASMQLIVGARPTVIDDFENYASFEDLDSKWYAYGGGHGYGNGGVNSIELGSYADGDKVRFGSHSLKINYDFTKVNNTTEGASAGYRDAQVIDGAPTAVGMWVYATEADQGFWLRARVTDGNGTTQQVDLTCQPSTCPAGVKPGINWTGWKYVQGPISTNWSLPLSINPGELVRFMYVPGNSMGSASAGHIYVDNIQFVYGANTDDVDTPIIDSIRINNQPVEEGGTVASNTVNIALNFHDAEGLYATGIDFEKLKIYVDGVDYSGRSDLLSVNINDSHAYINGLILNDGYHNLEAIVPDGFGNEAVQTLNFFVEGGEPLTNGYVEATSDSQVLLGSDFRIDLWAVDGEQLSTAQLVVQLGQLFQDVDIEVGTGVSYTRLYSQGRRQLTIDFTFDPGRVWTGEREIFATLKVKVPLSAQINNSTIFTLSSVSGSFTLTADSPIPNSAQAATFALPSINQIVQTDLTIADEPILVGQSALFRVSSNGSPVAGARVYRDDGLLLGETGDDGTLRIDNFSSEAGFFTCYAEKDGRFSFVRTSQVLQALGDSSEAPFNISLNLTGDSATAADITWFSYPLESGSGAQIRFAKSTDSSNGAWTTRLGSSEVLGFYGNTDYNLNGGVRLNRVALTGLQPNTTYRYQVGNGTVFSPVRTFKTSLQKAAVDFFVIGDTQTDDASKFNQVLDRLGADGKNYAFGLQTGDFIDKVTNYDLWNETLSIASESAVNSVPWLHVVGNHEIYGDEEAEISSKILSIPNRDYYSVEVGNVYLATIGYTIDRQKLEEALEWLVQDASLSSATFKILSIHQPAYYTNPAGGSELIHELVPTAVDRAAIDLVFSGHDHTFARTAEMRGGEVTSGGAAYFICGSTGEKSYSAVDNPDFNFATVNQSFGSIYLSVSATLDSITVDTYDGVTGQKLDSYVRPAYNNQDNHDFVYQNGLLSCIHCGSVVDPLVDLTSGIYMTPDGRRVYLLQGQLQKGYYVIGENRYYFDSEGYGYTGSAAIDGVLLKFENGLLVGGYSGFYRDAKGLRYLENGVPLYGLQHIESEYYYFGNDSYAVIGEAVISGITYYFTDDEDHYGQMIADLFYLTSNNRLKYYYTYGTVWTGVRQLRGATVYLDNSGYVKAVSGSTGALLLELYQQYYKSYNKTVAEFKDEMRNGLLDDEKLPVSDVKIDGEVHSLTFLDELEDLNVYPDYDICFRISGFSEPLPSDGLHIFSTLPLRTVATAESLTANKESIKVRLSALSGKISLSSYNELLTLQKQIDDYNYLSETKNQDLEVALSALIEEYNSVKNEALSDSEQLLITAQSALRIEIIFASVLLILVSAVFLRRRRF